MPTQERLRRHDQPVSAALRNQASERGEERAISRPQCGALFLPSERDELVSQHEQLDVFGELAAPASDKQPQHSREGEIGKGKEHEPILQPPAGKEEQEPSLETLSQPSQLQDQHDPVHERA